MKKKRLLLLGAYGQDNLGDELLLQTFLDLLNDYQITANSSDAKQTAEKFGIKTIATDGSKLTLFKHLIKSRVIVIGGGSQLKELPAVFGRNKNGVLFSLLLITVFARLMFKRVYFLNIGAGPLDGKLSRFLTRVVIFLSSAVILRDSGSLDLIRSITQSTKVHLGADALVYAADDIKKQIKGTKRNDKTVLMVPNLHTRKPELADHQVDLYVKLTDHLLKQGFTVNFLPFQKSFTDHNDLVAAQTIIGRVDGLTESAILDITKDSEVYDLFASHSAVVGVRLHSLIIAALTGTPMLALSYDPKVGGFMKDIGMDEYVFELDDTPEYKKVRDSLEQLYNVRVQAAKDITESVSAISARNRLAFESLSI